MNSDTSIPSVDATMALVQKAISAGVSEGEEAAVQLAAESKLRAAEIIATIPDLIRDTTKEHLRLGVKRSYIRATLMPLTAEDSPELFEGRTDNLFLDTRKLQTTGRIVFDHCEQAGLNPHITHRKPVGDGFVNYSLCIGWQLAIAEGAQVTSKKKRWWLLFLA